MDNKELSNMIVAAIRDPENLDNLSLHEVQMDLGSGESVSVEVLAWLNPDFTHSPMVIFCTPEITPRLKLELKNSEIDPV